MRKKVAIISRTGSHELQTLLAVYKLLCTRIVLTKTKVFTTVLFCAAGLCDKSIDRVNRSQRRIRERTIGELFELSIAASQ